MSDAPPVLELADTSRRLGGETDGFELLVPRFVVRRGECVAVTGPSGCGKSTLLDILGLALRPDHSARFLLTPGDGETIDIGDRWRRNDRDALAAVRACHIGYVLQTGGLLPFLSALENIQLSRVLLGLDPVGRIEKLAAVLAIGSLLGKKPHALSIGERQRVSIARALAHEPTLLLADEPTAALDPRNGTRVMKLLLALVQQLRITAIIVSHDWNLLDTLGLRRIEAEAVGGTGVASTRFRG